MNFAKFVIKLQHLAHCLRVSAPFCLSDFDGLNETGAQQKRRGRMQSQDCPDSPLLVFAHQDDEVLWMEPFLTPATALLLAASPPAPAHRRVVRELPCGYATRWHSSFPFVATDQEWLDSFALRDRCERDRDWNFEKIAPPISDWIAKPEVKSVVTHNSWGEYGHIHHRWVSKAVREAAACHGKDVWVLNNIVLFHGDGAIYLDLGDWGLPYCRKTFDYSMIERCRRIYQKASFDAEPRGFRAWTWFDGVHQYPCGIRTFVKIVDGGKDYIRYNPDIRAKVEAISSMIPFREACPKTAEHFSPL